MTKIRHWFDLATSHVIVTELSGVFVRAALQRLTLVPFAQRRIPNIAGDDDTISTILGFRASYGRVSRRCRPATVRNSSRIFQDRCIATVLSHLREVKWSSHLHEHLHRDVPTYRHQGAK